MALDPLAPVRESFIRVLDNARALQDLDRQLPVVIRERATVGLVAIGMADIATISESAGRIESALQEVPAALGTEAGRCCQAESVRIRELISRLDGKPRR